MNRRASKLINKHINDLDPRKVDAEIENATKRIWYRANKRERTKLRKIWAKPKVQE